MSRFATIKDNLTDTIEQLNLIARNTKNTTEDAIKAHALKIEALSHLTGIVQAEADGNYEDVDSQLKEFGNYLFSKRRYEIISNEDDLKRIQDKDLNDWKQSKRPKRPSKPKSKD